MKLEASLKHFSPQGMHISDDVKSTSPNRLNGTDIMTGIGVTSSRARFGLAAFFGKAGISKTDEQLAVQALARHAIDTAPKNVRKAAGKALGRCCLVLAQFALRSTHVRRPPAQRVTAAAEPALFPAMKM